VTPRESPRTQLKIRRARNPLRAPLRQEQRGRSSRSVSRSVPARSAARGDVSGELHFALTGNGDDPRGKIDVGVPAQRPHLPRRQVDELRELLDPLAPHRHAGTADSGERELAEPCMTSRVDLKQFKIATADARNTSSVGTVRSEFPASIFGPRSGLRSEASSLPPFSDQDQGSGQRSSGPSLHRPIFSAVRRPTGRRASRALGRNDDLRRAVALLSEERPIGDPETGGCSPLPAV
jgi:hypothetical protein